MLIYIAVLCIVCGRWRHLASYSVVIVWMCLLSPGTSLALGFSHMSEMSIQIYNWGSGHRSCLFDKCMWIRILNQCQEAHTRSSSQDPGLLATVFHCTQLPRNFPGDPCIFKVLEPMIEIVVRPLQLWTRMGNSPADHDISWLLYSCWSGFWAKSASGLCKAKNLQ